MSATLLLWQCLSLVSAVLMIGAVAVCVQAVWQRRPRLLLWVLPMACLYVLQQSIDYMVDPAPLPAGLAALVRWVTGLPAGAVIVFLLRVLVLLTLSARTLRGLERSEITGMSVMGSQSLYIGAGERSYLVRSSYPRCMVKYVTAVSHLQGDTGLGI